MRQIFHTLTMVFGKKINNGRFPMNKQNKSQSSDQSQKMSLNYFRTYAVTEIERFVRESAVKLNSRKIADRNFWAIMVDGIHIGGDVVVVILGVDTLGEKHFLSISQGSTENTEVVLSCLDQLRERGILFTEKVVAVIDGSKALKKALENHFDNQVVIQRCLNHKSWNVESKLAKKYHFEFKEKLRQAYGLNDYDEAKREFENLHN